MKQTFTYLLILFLHLITGVWVYPAMAQKNKTKASTASSVLPNYQILGSGLSKSDQRLLVLGDQYSQSEQYAEAVKYYEQLSQKQPDNIYIAYHRAECHRNLFQYAQAEAAYGKVAYADSVTYPEAVFYYGLMQKMNGKYAYAIHTFDTFLRQAAALSEEKLPQKKQWLDRTRQEQEGCQSALIREKFVQGNFHFKPLSASVNTTAHDYAPVLMGSDSLLVITSGRTTKKNPADSRLGEAFSDLYAYSLQNDTTGSVNKALLPNVNTTWSDGAGFLTADGTKFYFTSCQGPGVNCAIFVSERKNNRWQKPVRLNDKINETASDSRHPSLTPSGDTLYFVSNREGGYGMNDIWMSHKAGKEEWQTPVNLGSRINTAYNDVSPFYYATDRQLFFASDGHTGQGGLDLFFVNLSDAFRNRTALNLGPPFNSNRDDAFLVLGKEKGYLASNREGGVGNFDIYSFTIKSHQSEITSVEPSKNAAKADLAYLSEFQFEYLSTEEKLLLDQIASKREASRLYGIDLSLTEKEKRFYEKLSSQEKSRAEKMVTTLLSHKDSTALVAEDKFYYEKLATSEERFHTQRIAQAYRKALDDHSSVELAPEDKAYMESLGQIERNRLFRQIAGQLANRINGDVAAQEQDNYYYEKLSPEEKDRINRMAAARYAARMNNHDEELKSEDQFFYEKLSAEEKNQLDRVVANRMRQLSETLDGSMLTDEDRSYYEKLPVEEKERIHRMAAARYAAAVNATQEHFTEEDKFVYEKLSPEEKDRLGRLMAARTSGSATKMDLSQLSAEDQFQYEQLSSEAKDRINRMAAARYAARINGTDEKLTEEDAFFYEKLSPEEKQQIDRFVAVRMGMSRDGMDMSVLQDEDRSYYEKLPAEAKDRIERMAKARASATMTGNEPVFSQEDAFFYEKLSPEEKDRMNRLMVARTSGGRELMDKSLLEEGDWAAYEKLATDDKERLNRMAAARYAARINGTDEKFSPTDQFFYEKLSPKEKQQIDRMMAARAAGKGLFRDESTLDGETFSFRRIPSENNKVLNAKNGRKLQSSLVADESVLNGTTADDALSKLNASWVGKYKEIKLSGKLMDANTGQPAAGLSLPLVNDQGKVVKTTTTNPDGTFQYLNLPLSESVHIRVETPPASLTETQLLYVEDMELTAYRESSTPVNFESAYFEFDSYVLKRSTAQTLDKLVEYYKKNRTIQIELNAFTDDKGSEDYNLRLSNKRGLAVQTYLQNKGIPPGSLVMFARGKLKGSSVTRFGTPQTDAAARKVTISIQKSADQNSAETFVIVPDTDLEVIAQKTGVAVEKLRKLNGLKTNVVEPYRPIRTR